MQVDLTGIAVSVVAGVFSILSIVLPLLINARIKDSQAAQALAAAVKNSLGAMQQAATLGVTTAAPKLTIPGVSPEIAVGTQYVLDHAGAEAARFGITPEAIADKVSAQVGLVKLVAAIPAVAQLAPLSASVPVASGLSDIAAPRPPGPFV